jgi:hypothetical protein
LRTGELCVIARRIGISDEEILDIVKAALAQEAAPPD